MGSGMHIWALGCIYGLWDACMGSGVHIWALGCISGLNSPDDHGRIFVSVGCGEAGHQPYNFLRTTMPIEVFEKQHPSSFGE